MVEYIEREADYREICSDENMSGYEKAYCIELIRNIHASNVAPVRHGRWEQCFEDWRKQIEGDKCSVCGFEHYGASIKNYNYCPNCGAKMDEFDT